MGRRIIIISVAAIAIIAFLLTYLLFDPTAYEIFPKCQFLAYTGLKCPGCGSQRAIHALLNGKLCEAMKFNAVFVLSLVIVAIYIYGEFIKIKHPAFYHAISSRTVIYSLAAIYIAWWILRNIFNW